jgi:sterol desaturase/sphingolipid hydroxylase (fatty acid hydroxylase superfamily)
MDRQVAGGYRPSMTTTTYRWTPPRLVHRLYPLLLAGLWWGAWASPPGQWALAGLRAWLPGGALAAVGLGVLTFVVTYGTIAAFHHVDTTGRPAWLARRKIQQPFTDPRRPSTAEALRVHLINHAILVVGLVIFAFALQVRGWTADQPALPWWGVLLQLVAMGIGTEILFFSAHYALHTRWLYRHVHVVHHRFRAPTAWSAQFAHPVEYVMGNMIPIAVPMVLVAPDVVTLWCFGLIALVNTQLVHSGYQLPVAPWAIAHDLHHFKVNVNYGSIGLMDRIFGTRLLRVDERGAVPTEGDAPPAKRRRSA